MTKVLLTATPGSGKTSAIHELQARGFTAYDIDSVPDAVKLQVKTTGESADWPEGFVDWEYYAWNLQEDKLTELLESDENVFIGVSATNQSRFYPLFDHIFALVVSDEQLRQQLVDRTATEGAHEHGQGPDNIDRAVRNNQERIARYASEGSVLIRNDSTVQHMADEILRLANVHRAVAE